MNLTSVAGPLLAFLSAVTWAIGSSNYSKLSLHFTPFQVNLTRAMFSLPLFLIAAFVTAGGFTEGVEAFQTLRLDHVGWFSLSMVASYGLGDVLFLWSTRSLGVPGALAIACSYPILTTVFGVLFLDQAVSPAQWVGLSLSSLGIATLLLTTAPLEKEVLMETSTTPSRLQGKKLGIFLALATAICWATNSFCVARGGADLNSAVASTLRMTLALGIISLFSVIVGHAKPSFIDLQAFKKYAWVFLVEAFLGTYFFMYGLSHTSLALGSVLASLAPVVAVPVSIALGLERFSWVRTVAILTVVTGLALI